MTSTCRNLRAISDPIAQQPHVAPWARRRSQKDDNALLDSLPRVLLRIVQLLLQELYLAQQALVGLLTALALVLRRFELIELALRFLEVRVEHAQLVLERGDLLVALEERELELLVLGLSLLGARNGGVGLAAELLESLRVQGQDRNGRRSWTCRLLTARMRSVMV